MILDSRAADAVSGKTTLLHCLRPVEPFAGATRRRHDVEGDADTFLLGLERNRPVEEVGRKYDQQALGRLHGMYQR